MTAYGTVENAVEAMKQGAYDFVTKPIKRAHLVRVVGKALEKRSLVQENRSLRAQLAAEKRRTLIGQSLPWRRTMEIVMQAAPSQATVLLLGRVGHRQGAAGARDPRQLAARGRAVRAGQLRRAARDASSRPSCSATRRAPSPARSSATTGASCRPTAARCSSTRSARSRPHVQVKLLRVLQEGEVERLGGADA